MCWERSLRFWFLLIACTLLFHKHPEVTMSSVSHVHKTLLDTTMLKLLGQAVTDRNIWNPQPKRALPPCKWIKLRYLVKVTEWWLIQILDSRCLLSRDLGFNHAGMGGFRCYETHRANCKELKMPRASSGIASEAWARFKCCQDLEIWCWGTKSHASKRISVAVT